MTARSNKTTILFGMRETGKTTYAKKLAGMQQQKVLVIDTFDHPSYRDEYEPITREELAEWGVSKEKTKRRIFGGDIQELVEYAFTVCFDALIIVEDAAKVFDSNIPRKLKMVVIDHRNRGLDVIMIFHSYSDIAPYLCRMWDIMITFRTEDDLSNKQTKFSKWHIISLVQHKLRDQPDKHAKDVVYRE